MYATQAYVSGNTVTIQDEILKDFDGQKITVNIIFPEQKKRAIEDFFALADELHLNSHGQKWTREEMHER